jgi:hypothetical protein
LEVLLGITITLCFRTEDIIPRKEHQTNIIASSPELHQLCISIATRTFMRGNQSRLI